MSSAALLVVLLAAGFYAGTKWKVSKVYISKDSGHPLYFFSALIALFLFIVAIAVDQAATRLLPYQILTSGVEAAIGSLIDPASTPRSVQLSVLTSWAVLLSFAFPRLLNWPLNSNPTLLDQIAERYGEREAIDDVVRDVLRLQIPLAVTLDDSKVYIGFPIAGEPFGVASKRWFRLRPMLSGYRDEARDLKLTIDYQAVIANLSVGSAISVAERAFDVVVPFDRITSVHPFDLESYEKYFMGTDWSQSDQLARLDELNNIAQGAEPDASHRRDYWAFVALASLSPFLLLFEMEGLALCSLALAVAFGLQAARPSPQGEE